jgi:hypothetical protein
VVPLQVVPLQVVPQQQFAPQGAIGQQLGGLGQQLGGLLGGWGGGQLGGYGDIGRQLGTTIGSFLPFQAIPAQQQIVRQLVPA